MFRYLNTIMMPGWMRALKEAITKEKTGLIAVYRHLFFEVAEGMYLTKRFSALLVHTVYINVT